LTQKPGPALRPSWIVASLVTAGILLGILVGLVTLIQALTGGRSFSARPLFESIVNLVIFIPAGLGLLRYNVLGRPPVRFSVDGVSVGSLNIPWGTIGSVTARSFLFMPYLVVEVTPEAKGRLPWYDRLAMSLGTGGGAWRTLWVSEQQVGSSAAEAAELADHVRR
jgi:hypothetical protein